MDAREIFPINGKFEFNTNHGPNASGENFYRIWKEELTKEQRKNGEVLAFWSNQGAVMKFHVGDVSVLPF